MNKQIALLFSCLLIIPSISAMEETDSKDHSVSLIYYPNQRRSSLGHTELEVDGEIVTEGFSVGIPRELAEKVIQSKDEEQGLQQFKEFLLEHEEDLPTILEMMKPKRKKLQKMIELSQSGKGMPFYRFVFNTTPQQRKNLKQNALSSGICTRRALEPLEAEGVTSVPLPVGMLPMYTALYLKASHTMGCNNVKDVQFYGGNSRIMNGLKMAPGFLQETTFGAAIIAQLGLMSYITYQVTQMNNE